jgi:hypothetical protein
VTKTVFDNGGYVGFKGTYGQNLGSNVVTTGLVMHVDAGKTASYPGTGTTWTDLAGTVSAGTLVNGPTYSSSNGGFLTFNGSNSLVTFPNSTALDNQALTMEVWVKPTSLGQSAFWFEKGNVNTQYSFFCYSGYIYWRGVFNGSLADLTVAESTAGLSTSTWQQMVATYITGTGKRIYRNGTQVASDAQTGTVGTNAGGMSIGAYGGTGGNSYFYNGGLAICRIYNRALSLTEIQQNYNDQKSRFGL